jgi:hypothetical protein
VREGEVLRSLEVLEEVWSSVFDASAAYVLPAARAQVRESYARYMIGQSLNPRQHVEWGYSIPFDQPLSFVATDVHGLRLRCDIVCEIRWLDPANPPVHQELVVRLWAMDLNVMFRSHIDHEDVFETLDGVRGRVMMRYHFDLANTRQAGPRYHVQAGGNARAEEACWLHGAIEIPRLPYQPLDLVLACEVVVANLYDPWPASMSDPSLIGAIATSQAELLTEYYETIRGRLNARGSVLAGLWNS